jgi:hypothetical protein
VQHYMRGNVYRSARQALRSQGNGLLYSTGTETQFTGIGNFIHNDRSLVHRDKDLEPQGQVLSPRDRDIVHRDWDPGHRNTDLNVPLCGYYLDQALTKAGHSCAQTRGGNVPPLPPPHGPHLLPWRGATCYRLVRRSQPSRPPRGRLKRPRPR